jgi:tetratricopeptide (TPR) repeat protein
MSAPRSSRPGPDGPRRQGGSGRGRAGASRPSRSSRPSRPPRGGGRSGPPSSGRRTGPARRTRDTRDDRPAPPRTEAERRAAEVRARRGPRPPRDPDKEAARIAERTVEQWIDEGSVRAEAEAAARRATSVPRRRSGGDRVSPDVAAQVAEAVGNRRSERLLERLAAASNALDRERFDEARRIVTPLTKELPDVAAVHEVAGLVAYRLGRWKQAAAELEAARSLKPAPELLPVLADSYRALRRWGEVDRLWADVRRASPAHDVMSEARIVVAGAHADRGDLRAAIDLLQATARPPKRVRDHHLRQWYALADLYDRAGDTVDARRWFRAVAEHDPDFVDVTDRLRALGR